MTKHDILCMALDCGAAIKSDCEGNGVFGDGIDLLKFAALAEAHGAAEERNAIADAVSKCDSRATPKGIAAAIRARGQG